MLWMHTMRPKRNFAKKMKKMKMCVSIAVVFTDLSATTKTSYVTSSVEEIPNSMTSSGAPGSEEGLVMTSATPESPISAQLIQSTIAPFTRINRIGFRFIYLIWLAEKTKDQNVTNVSRGIWEFAYKIKGNQWNRLRKLRPITNIKQKRIPMINKLSAQTVDPIDSFIVMIIKIESGKTTPKSRHIERMDHNVIRLFQIIITRLEKNI